jgi:hypothetical protein
MNSSAQPSTSRDGKEYRGPYGNIANALLGESTRAATESAPVSDHYQYCAPGSPVEEQ